MEVSASARDNWKVKYCEDCRARRRRIKEISLRFEAKTDEEQAECERLMRLVSACSGCTLVPRRTNR
jgi:hypothetical protein